MRTLRNLFLAAGLASVCLVPMVSADVSRALSGRPLALAVRDFATTTVLTSDDPSTMSAELPHMLSGMLSSVWSQVTGH
jgi:hypothetical protein